MATLLDIRHLTVQFPTQDRQTTTVGDLSFAIAHGEVLGLVGESGSGKSVTSLAMMRLLPPQARTSGEILFSNGTGSARDLLQLAEAEMRGLRGTAIANQFDARH